MHSWFKPPPPSLPAPPQPNRVHLAPTCTRNLYLVKQCAYFLRGDCGGWFKNRSRWHRARHNVDSLNSQRGYLLLIFMSLLLLNSEYYSPHSGLSLKAPWWFLKSKRCVFRRVGRGELCYCSVAQARPPSGWPVKRFVVDLPANPSALEPPLI